MNTVLVTGSAGFIGTHLSEHYLKLGVNVIGLDNYLTGSIANTEYLKKQYPNNFIFIDQDASDTFPTIHEKIKFVFHLASPASVKSYQKFPLAADSWSGCRRFAGR